MANTPTASKPRTLVNLLGIPGILTVIWLGGWWFSLFVWVVILLGSVELKKLVQIQGGTPIMGLLFLSVSAVIFNYKFDSNYFEIIILFTGITAFSIEIFRNQKKPLLNISTVIMGSIWLGAMLGSLIILREQPGYGLELILLLFLSVWACDSAAFFFGKLFGRKKILPSVSPKKSWVGSISGLLAAVIVSYLLYATAPLVFGFVDFGMLSGIFRPIDIVILGINLL